MDLLQKATEIVKALQDNGHEAVFAGGCVRDMQLGIEPKDYDIATSASPQMVEDLFMHTIPVGKSFGVIVVKYLGDHFEVATFRVDGEYTDGRRPECVTFASMEEDAQRRDLTINAMFYNPITKSFIDIVGGMDDLKGRKIHFVGNAAMRIQEDKLRMLRAVRFAVKFKFTMRSDTIDAIINNAQFINQVSKERIKDEFLKIMRLGSPRAAITLLITTGLLRHILPEVLAMAGVEQSPEYHPEGDVLEHTILALEALPSDASDTLIMGALLHDVGKHGTFKIAERIRFDGHDVLGAEMAEKVLRRLKFSNDDREQIVSLVRNHMKWLAIRKMRKAKVKRFMQMPMFDEHVALHKVDCASCHGNLENLEFIKTIDMSEDIRPTRLITGRDLIDKGLNPGTLFKTIITDIEDRQLEGEINTREEALKVIDEYI